jgi:hypothetical protein
MSSEAVDEEIARGRAEARAWLRYLVTIGLEKWEQERELEKLWRLQQPQAIDAS